jgi:formylmethanofuran dehydrogenase subunit A
VTLDKGDVGAAFDGAAFEVKGGEAFAIEDGDVLHEHNVKKAKFVGMDVENAIDSC